MRALLVPSAAALAAAALLAPAGPADARERIRATLAPTPVDRGSALTVTGSGWAPGTARLLAGPPASEADPVARVRVGRDGRFRARVPIAATAARGPYVMLVCQRACRVKVTLAFRVR